jgi:hypothetical protein
VIDRLAECLLGTHVGDRPDDAAGLREARVRQLGDAEVENLHIAVRGQHDVGRLHVAVDDAAVVRLAKASRHRGGDAQGVGGGERPAGDRAVERLALVASHHDVQLVVVGLADLVDRADVRMLERRGGTRLDHEALLGRFVRAQVGRQELEGDVASEARVVSPINDPHSTTAETLDDLVSGQRRNRRAERRVPRCEQGLDEGARELVELPVALVRDDECLDFASHVIARAGFGEPRVALGGGAIERSVEQVLNALPPLGRHLGDDPCVRVHR